jgi:hypothetical protein
LPYLLTWLGLASERLGTKNAYFKQRSAVPITARPNPTGSICDSLRY